MVVNDEWLSNRAKRHLERSADVKIRMLGDCLGSIVLAAEKIAECLRTGGKLLLCGNGGSAGDCQHIAAGFVSSLTQEFARPGMRALALTTDSSLLTAYINDFGLEGVFARQVETLGDPGDTLLAISTSGSSGNVVAAVETARRMGPHTIGLAGNRGRLAEISDVTVSVPSDVTQHTQEAHITVGHILCDLVERQIFGRRTQEASQ